MISDSVGRPSGPLGALGVGVKNSKSSVSCEASAKNRTSVGLPSASIRPHPPPSAPIGGLWVGVKVGYGFPPSIPPDFLYAYNVDVVGVVGIVLTRRRESADLQIQEGGGNMMLFHFLHRQNQLPFPRSVCFQM